MIRLFYKLSSIAYIKIPCSNAGDGNWSVFYIDEDGKLEEMTVVVLLEGGAAVAYFIFSRRKMCFLLYSRSNRQKRTREGALFL